MSEVRKPYDGEKPAVKVLFQAAVSGLWYDKPEAAGDISAVTVDGALFKRYDPYSEESDDSYPEDIEG